MRLLSVTSLCEKLPLQIFYLFQLFFILFSQLSQHLLHPVNLRTKSVNLFSQILCFNILLSILFFKFCYSNSKLIASGIFCKNRLIFLRDSYLSLFESSLSVFKLYLYASFIKLLIFQLLLGFLEFILDANFLTMQVYCSRPHLFILHLQLLLFHEIHCLTFNHLALQQLYSFAVLYVNLAYQVLLRSQFSRDPLIMNKKVIFLGLQLINMLFLALTLCLLPLHTLSLIFVPKLQLLQLSSHLNELRMRVDVGFMCLFIALNPRLASVLLLSDLLLQLSQFVLHLLPLDFLLLFK